MIKMLQYFFARAKGGTGLLTTGLIPVSHGIDPTVTEVDDLSLFPRIDHARTVFAGWRDLAQGVHAYGSKNFYPDYTRSWKSRASDLCDDKT